MKLFVNFNDMFLFDDWVKVLIIVFYKFTFFIDFGY